MKEKLLRNLFQLDGRWGCNLVSGSLFPVLFFLGFLVQEFCEGYIMKYISLLRTKPGPSRCTLMLVLNIVD